MAKTKKPEWWTVVFVVLLCFSVGIHLMQAEQQRQAAEDVLGNIEGSVAIVADMMQNEDSMEDADETVNDAEQILIEAIGQMRALGQFMPDQYSIDNDPAKALQELDRYFVLYINESRTQENFDALKDLSLVYSIYLKAENMKDAEAFSQLYQDMQSQIREEGYLSGTDFEEVSW
ncbi:hypothetical protein [Jeotgalibacillus sp. JSM ZJ347]|uniref:hypothetical protein n=1 Tax=Jeotgalibacillus sp. JSM ZJ347 TaxID=3342117 RepID=UPI0035A9547C